MSAHGGRKREGAGGRTLVADGDLRRPFMRGIMIHSLMARGISFEDAFHAANAVRDRIRGRAHVDKDELAKLAEEILGEEVLAEARPPFPPAIRVMGEGKGLPFSKGVLSQSLLAAAIEPNDAFEVAREIEGELLRRNVREIDRRDLRRIAYDALRRRMGDQTGERYLVWRRYQEPERPVIVLLGGTAGVGKSSLALEVAHRLGIGRVFSSDSIRQIMRIMLSPELVPAIHASSYDAWRMLPPESLDEDDRVIDGFRAQAATVAVGVRASIDRAISENASLVLEGVSVVPGLVDPAPYEEVADVIFLIVATLEEEAFANRFQARAAVQHRRGTHRYLTHLPAIRHIQDHLLEVADRHDVPIVDNVSFDHSVLLVIRHVAETLRKRGSVDVSGLV